jgi:hypothetical protein
MASGIPIQTRVNQAFHRPVIDFSDPGARAGEFQALIDWGDGSSAVRGQVEGRGHGRFVVLGAHRFPQAGTFSITVTLVDSAGQATVVPSWANAVARGPKAGRSELPRAR